MNIAIDTNLNINFNFYLFFLCNLDNSHNQSYFLSCFSASQSEETEMKEVKYKDWVFFNYTFKRFEGLTQRGPNPHKS